MDLSNEGYKVNMVLHILSLLNQVPGTSLNTLNKLVIIFHTILQKVYIVSFYILLVIKLRHREIKQFAWGYIANM